VHQSKLYEFLKDKPDIDILISGDDKESHAVADIPKFLEIQTFILPDFRANWADDLRSYKDELFAINKTLKAYYAEKKRKLLITPLHTLNYPLPKENLLRETILSFGDLVEIDAFKEQLLSWGYSFVDIVEDEGEVSVRGDIIDIFPLGSEYPIRISLFDDEIESIRYYDPSSQKSKKEELDSCEITPAFFSINHNQYEAMVSKFDALNSDSIVGDFNSLGFWTLDEMGSDLLEKKRCYFLDDLSEMVDDIAQFYHNTLPLDRFKNIPTIPPAKEYKDLVTSDPKSLIAFHKNKKRTILYKNDGQLKQYVDINIDAKLIQCEYAINILSSSELIISLNKPEKKKRKKKSKIILDELNIGSYVVHEDYGVGIFKGLTQKTVLGSTRDFAQINYQGDDILLLPVENLGTIDRYISDSGSLAVIDKLGKGSFGKIKAKAREKLFEIAKEIVEIAANRELLKTEPLTFDDAMLTLFQQDAGFVYTVDQDRAIEAILKDLKQPKAMDRLLSGDVGFGKTEVAMNAIFATVVSKKQSAFIVPTTLLSAQHYKSLKTRLSKYDIKIVKYDRFTTSANKAKIKNELLKGEIDVVIGTHGVMDLEFENLFLVVLDEEHKFGVKQKEKLKNFKSTTHILSMSATPIPRSLNMALSSIKSYSTLMSAPSEREDIKTYVKEYNPTLLKDSIMREIRRGGQVFYIHNRIASIESKKEELQALLPNLRILTLHSKISAAATEKEMLNFEDKKYDLLISTSIVESGIHIPNVNTIIIEDANNFGIADLHQLRGRVGRGNRQGYCYYIVEDKDRLSDQAIKRLLALESNSFLGSGSALAYHDLEIRGGGNLVGVKQSGHIKNIGYSLYLKMLEDAINILMNTIPVEKKEVNINLTVTAFLSSDLISEDRLRLELYRRLSGSDSVKEVYEIEEEIEDRFGKIDEITTQFLKVIIIKIKASKLGFVKVSNYAQNITLEYENEKKEYLKAKSKDDDDILLEILNYLDNRITHN
jgi:transcription-repair coupling factor (superfamily II helicase)